MQSRAFCPADTACLLTCAQGGPQSLQKKCCKATLAYALSTTKRLQPQASPACFHPLVQDHLSRQCSNPPVHLPFPTHSRACKATPQSENVSRRCPRTDNSPRSRLRCLRPADRLS